eukprot:scaffold218635_cov20-Prasinocladus_malaysianus.AAC.1
MSDAFRPLKNAMWFKWLAWSITSYPKMADVNTSDVSMTSNRDVSMTAKDYTYTSISGKAPLVLAGFQLV